LIKIIRFSIVSFLLFFMAMSLKAQSGATVRGYVFDKENGEPVMFTNVFLKGSEYGTLTDQTGFYNISGIKPGTYTLMATGISYDTSSMQITLKRGEIVNQQILLGISNIQLTTVNIDAQKIEKKREVLISTVKIKPRDIQRIPTVGGEADLAQYLQILPGIISTGDQGGQIYIRGGAPVYNKLLLDGKTVYNAFHSIGLFSVYETEIIRNVKVMTGGFNAEYGGRISAVIDVTTRDGNKKKFSGMVSVNPFVAKFLVEGPIQKLDENGASISYMLTGKHSYLKQTSKALYQYAKPAESTIDEVLPYNFTDFFGKISFNGAEGSRLNVTGFNFNDRASFDPVADFKWSAFGVGTEFSIIPGQSKTIIGGNLDYSNYTVELIEADGKPRFSSIGGFNMGMDFTYFLENDGKFKYGIDINGFSTRFEFFNSLGLKLDQNQNTTELGGYMVYRKNSEKWVIEPGLRIQYYASLSNISFEPRLGLKYNASDRLRFKFAGGFYSQNLISTKSDQDVVNLFVGFLSGPEEVLKKVDGTGTDANHKLQKAIHAILGVEYDITRQFELNIEPYFKYFPQLINLNRNKIFKRDPNYMIETSKAYGIDFLLKYDNNKWYFWGTYSLGFVTRYDGNQTYAPFYDRRHNVNVVGAYVFGEDKSWEVSGRWNYGSGFPFTLTQGFFEQIDFSNGVSTDYTTQNGNLGIIFDEKLNAGRLPDYHRLDFSLKKWYKFGKYLRLEFIASISNVYNRDNIFYFDRVRYQRVDQLPILPSFGVKFSF
jgi:CarboxypepD_reg-like domain/TonB-dependent Receptor Plug Domain